MSAIRVLLVDDQQIIRQGLATVLRYAPGIKVVGQAGNGQAAVNQRLDLRPDVVLMDLKMPRLGGIPVTRQICAKLPDSHVIILSTYDDDDLVFEGIKAGARGYLLKDTSSEMLVEAIWGMVQGKSPLNPAAARKVRGPDGVLALVSAAPWPGNAPVEAGRSVAFWPISPILHSCPNRAIISVFMIEKRPRGSDQPEARPRRMTGVKVRIV